MRKKRGKVPPYISRNVYFKCDKITIRMKIIIFLQEVFIADWKTDIVRVLGPICVANLFVSVSIISYQAKN